MAELSTWVENNVGKGEITCNDQWVKPFPKRQILDSSKLKGFAEDNFKF